jgi:WD40 repeat protein
MRRVVFEDDGTEAVHGLQFSRDGLRLVGYLSEEETRLPFRFDVTRDQTLSIDVPDGEDFERLPNSPDPVWNPSGEVFVELIEDYSGKPSLRIVDYWAKPVQEVLYDGVNVHAYAFDDEGENIYIARDSDGSILLTEHLLESIQEKRASRRWSLDTDDVAPSCLMVSPSRDWIAMGLFNGGLWLIHTRQRLATICWQTLGDDRPIEKIEFSPKGDRLLAVVSKRVVVWDFATQAQNILETWAHLNSACFLPSGDILVASGQGDVLVFDGQTLQETRRLNFETGAITSVATSPDGLLAALGTCRSEAWLIDLE